MAWVLFENAFDTSGNIFNVDTTSAACTSTTYQPDQHKLDGFGMGFVSDTDGGTAETLFIAGGNNLSSGSVTSSTLATLDTTSLIVTPIGTVSGEPELTGTGSGQLWGFFPSVTNPTISQIDKVTGALSNTFNLPQLAGQPLAWAFAFYGGDFWVFLQREKDASTIVWHVNGQTGNVDEAVPPQGKVIVGAGESTCVPVGPPTQ